MRLAAGAGDNEARRLLAGAKLRFRTSPFVLTDVLGRGQLFAMDW
jgi:hypothetical protein